MSRLHRDIAALADGTGEAPGLRERIAADPELQALLDEQRRAVALTRAARPPAPPQLRAALAGPPPPPAAAARRPRRPVAGLAVAAAGVLALAVVALLPGGATPSVTRVAALALRGPAGPAPAVDARHPDTLGAEIAGVRYPDWQEAFGFRATGARTDRVEGRTTMTVYYASATEPTVGYTIVAGPALPEPSGGLSDHASGGTRYLGLTSGGRTIVTWRRAGHTCVISATGVPVGALLRLAEWRYQATPT
jgi:hypothetical protein